MRERRTDELDLLAAAHAAAEVAVAAARPYGRLPSLCSREFLAAPVQVRLAVLAVCGLSYVLADDVLGSWAGEDFSGGPWHRQALLLPSVTELRRRRYPPTGDRELWVRHGPAGDPVQRTRPGTAA